MKGRIAFLKSVLALFLVQGLSFAIPLVLLAHLARVLSTDEFAAYTVYTAVLQLALVITDYGFSIYGTGCVARSLSRETREQLLVEITASKLLTSIAGVFIVAGLIALVPGYGVLLPTLAWTCCAVLAQGLTPAWFFLGLEKPGVALVYTVAPRALALYVLVHANGLDVSADQAIRIWSCATMLGCILAFAAARAAGFRLQISSVHRVAHHLRAAWPYFASRAAVSAYSTSSVLVLGAYAGAAQTAAYAVAEQIYRAVQGFMQPIVSAIYPYMVRTNDRALLFRILLCAVSLAVITAALMASHADDVVQKFAGRTNEVASDVLVVFSLLIPATVASVLIGYPLLTAMGCSSWANRSVLYGALAYFLALACILVAGHLTAWAVAIAVVAAELTILILRLRVVATKSRV